MTTFNDIFKYLDIFPPFTSTGGADIIHLTSPQSHSDQTITDRLGFSVQ